MLSKSRGLTVDTVAYDLEDSVTPNQKPEARLRLRDFLAQSRAEGIGEQAVRINSVDSGFALADLTEVVSFKFVCLSNEFISESRWFVHRVFYCSRSNDGLNP